MTTGSVKVRFIDAGNSAEADEFTTDRNGESVGVRTSRQSGPNEYCSELDDIDDAADCERPPRPTAGPRSEQLDCKPRMLRNDTDWSSRQPLAQTRSAGSHYRRSR